MGSGPTRVIIICSEKQSFSYQLQAPSPRIIVRFVPAMGKKWRIQRARYQMGTIDHLMINGSSIIEPMNQWGWALVVSKNPPTHFFGKTHPPLGGVHPPTHPALNQPKTAPNSQNLSGLRPSWAGPKAHPGSSSQKNPRKHTHPSWGGSAGLNECMAGAAFQMPPFLGGWQPHSGEMTNCLAAGGRAGGGYCAVRGSGRGAGGPPGAGRPRSGAAPCGVACEGTCARWRPAWCPPPHGAPVGFYLGREGEAPEASHRMGVGSRGRNRCWGMRFFRSCRFTHFIRFCKIRKLAISIQNQHRKTEILQPLLCSLTSTEWYFVAEKAAVWRQLLGCCWKKGDKNCVA